MENKYILSLSTIPSKFDNISLTMDSLINQTYLPEKIIVNIPKIYSFRLNNSYIPQDKITDFKNKYSNYNVYINLIEEDYGPGTKLIGALYSNLLNYSPNTYIILVDDDLIYKPYMIDHFDRYLKLTNSIVCSHCVNNFQNIKIAKGADGFLIKLDILDKFLKYFDLIKNYDYIKYHDDFYISYYLNILKKINIEYIKPPYNLLIYNIHINTNIDALQFIKGKYARANLNKELYEILNELNNNGIFKEILN